MGGGVDETSESKQRETALDGLAAEQMWMRERERWTERGNGKDRDGEEREGASLLIYW